MKKLYFRYKKEIITLTLLMFLVMSITTFITYKQISDSLSSTYLNKLSVLKYSLSSHISDYFKENKNALISISLGETTASAIKDFSKDFISVKSEYSKEFDEKFLLEDIEDFVLKVRQGVPFSNKIREVPEFMPKDISAKILQTLYISNNPFGSSDKYQLYSSSKNINYDSSHKKYHSYFVDALKLYGFYDIFLINMNGDIVYSVFKELDFATNLNNGIYKNSSLAEAFKGAVKQSEKGISFSDFKPYEPTYNKPASFIGTPIYENGKKIGVLAVQLSIDEINNVMTLNESQKDVGLQNSGEAYLVGSDYYMRSNSRFMAKMTDPLVDEFSTTVGITKVFSESSKRALTGENNSGLINDYSGVEVFSSYAPIDIFDKRWGIIVEIDSDEIFHSINLTTRTIIFTSIVLMLLFFILMAYLSLRLILKPMEKQEEILAENIKLKNKEIDSSHRILTEYKKAVDLSSIVSKTTPKGIVTYVNDAFCNISGYKREEIIGQSHSLIRHPDMSREIFKDLWNTILNKRVWKGVVKNLKKDGGVYYVNSTIIPILDSNGNITEFISIRSDVTELVEKEQQILDQTTDKVTSLPNREKLIEDINIDNKHFKMAIIQIDKFKEVNDFYGIETGDLVLINLSSIFKRVIEQSELALYKISGDEFAILESKDMPIYEFEKKIKNIIKYFDHNIVVVSDNSFNISVTVGIATGHNTKLFFNSEMALRKAKENSKSLLAYENSDDIQKQYQDNIEMTTKIKNAINNDNIIIYVQPIKANNLNAKEKFECLVRMRDDDKVISPFFFLDIAKKARIYHTITKIVIEKSFKYFENLDSEFSINLNIEDILNEEIVLFLKKKIKDYRIGHRLVLEIVESEGIENFDYVNRFIEDVKALGCKIAIDDFGTGYSNFEYLLKLKADYIKIDGSLIKNLDHDKDAELIVRLLLDFAKHQNIQTIGEFVHSDAVYQKVKSMGIDYSQGYYLGEPVPID